MRKRKEITVQDRTQKNQELWYTSGSPMPFGASRTGNGGINFSVNSDDAWECTLVLYHRGEKEPFCEIPIPQEFRIGSNYSVTVFGLDPEDVEYGYRFDGPCDPEKGFYFDRSRVLLDPYAKLVSGRESWGRATYPDSDFPIRGRLVSEDFDWEGDRPLNRPLNETVIYEMHVRGFTRGSGSGVKAPGTFEGILEKIPYLKELGINCIELLPIFEFDETEYRRFQDTGREFNYWGYSTVCFFAPKAAYGTSGPLGMTGEEFKETVKTLHKNGIEVILDVVFNHTAEMGDGGPVFSYKGIDARTYYLLNPDGTFCNYSGCGNTVNCNNAVVRNHILDCLRYWVSVYHVDGFRFDEAPILSRDENGAPMANPPLLELLANDSILSKTKLIAEAWDAAGLYQLGNFPAPARWAEWNGKFRDCVRHCLKSDAEYAPELLWRIQGSPDIFPGGSTDDTVNFITCHDGFTLYDLTAYNCKHNEANFENNRDGVDNNISWNSGAEGETDDAGINALRRRQVKNAAALLFLSRGVPMMLMGDEMMNSQGGNNNCYCQDNEISWLDWRNEKKNRDVFDFFRAMIRLRRESPVITTRSFFTGYNKTGYPEMSFHGETPWQLDMGKPFYAFGVLYAQEGEKYRAEDKFIYLAVNLHWEERTLTLPLLPAGMHWTLYAYSAAEKAGGEDLAGESITLTGRSTAVLVSKRDGEEK